MKVSKITRVGRKLLKLQYCGAVILAAGTASRMGGIDKVMAPLAGEPLIVHSVRAFENCDAIREIVIVTREDLVIPIMDLCHGFSKVRAVIVGGDSRQASVMRGLGALSNKTRLAAVHDGARPMITEALIDTVVRAGNTYGAAMPAVPVKDTIKKVQGGIVAETPDRAILRGGQTPQVFDLDLLRGALAKAQKDNVTVTDDSAAVERLGMSVRVVDGDEKNIKVTTPMDLKIAEIFMEERQ